MNYYDHLIRFDDEDAAKAHPIIGQYWSTEAGWDQSVMITSADGLTVSAITGEHEVTDAETGQTYTEATLEPLPYFYVCLCLPEINQTLKLECMVVADRQSNEIVHTLIPVNDLAGYRIEPMLAGMTYTFSG